MTSYEFEVISKNIVIKTFKDKYDIDLDIKDVDLVWFAHELGYKKCTIYGIKMGKRYAEITYNKEKDEIYLDIYCKELNEKITSDMFDKEVH